VHKQQEITKTYGAQTTGNYQDLWRTNNRNILLLFVRHKSWCSVVSLGRYSFFPARVGLRTYQYPFVEFKYMWKNAQVSGPKKTLKVWGTQSVKKWKRNTFTSDG